MILKKRDLQAAIVGQVLRGMSPGVRGALLWLPADGSPREETAEVSRSIWALASRTVIPGVEAKLAAYSTDAVGRGGSRSWKLLPFGQLVQAALLKAREAANG